MPLNKDKALVVSVIGVAATSVVSAGLLLHMRGVSAAQQQPTQAANMLLQTDGPLYNGAKVAAAGIPPIYDFSGNAIVGAKCAQGYVVSDTTGAFSVDYTALGFSTAITRADVSTANNVAPGGVVTSLTGMYVASFSEPSLTTLKGRVTVPTTVVVGSMAVAFATTPVKVYVTVCGS